MGPALSLLLLASAQLAPSSVQSQDLAEAPAAALSRATPTKKATPHARPALDQEAAHKAFRARAIRMKKDGGAWYEDLTAEGQIIFTREGGETLSRSETLRAVGAQDLAQKQAAAELTQSALPFLLAFPLFVPAILGIGLGGLRPSVRGDNLDVILEATWNGAALGGAIGLVLSALTLGFSMLTVRWLRASDLEVTHAISAYNLEIASQLGLHPKAVGQDYVGLLDAAETE